MKVKEGKLEVSENAGKTFWSRVDLQVQVKSPRAVISGLRDSGYASCSSLRASVGILVSHRKLPLHLASVSPSYYNFLLKHISFSESHSLRQNILRTVFRINTSILL